MFIKLKHWCFVLFFLLCLSYALGQFSVGLLLGEVHYNMSGVLQLNSTALANGTNVSIRIPIIYNTLGIKNVSPEKPPSWYNGSHWYILEDSQIINVTANETHLEWEANLSKQNVTLTFQVYPPYIVNVSVFQSKPFYEKNFTVTSLNQILNISVNISINNSYHAYYVLWYSGGWLNRTIEFHLSIYNDSAFFYGFSTSNQYFRLQGYCIPDWRCEAWGSCINGIQFRSCTDRNNCTIVSGRPDISQSCEVFFPSGGGGAARKIEVNKDFDVSPKIIRLKLKEGSRAKKSFRIENYGDILQKFRINSEQGYIKIENSTLFIESQDSISVVFTIDTKGLNPDSYLGKITVTNGEIEKEILIILEVESELRIIDLHLDIAPEYTMVKPGDSVIGTVTIYNLFKEPRYVMLHYYLKDLNSNILLEESEKVYVEDQLGFEKEIHLPKTIEPGSYIFSVNGKVEEYVSVSSELIKVYTEKPLIGIERPVVIEKPDNRLLITFFIVIILLVIGLFFFKIRQIEKKPSGISQSVREKQRLLLQKKIEEERERRKLEKALRQRQKQEAKKRFLQFEEKQSELKKRLKSAEQERLRLERLQKKTELSKKKELLRKQQLKQEAEKDRIRLKMQRLLEQEKQRKQELVDKNKERIERLIEQQKRIKEYKRKKEKGKGFFTFLHMLRSYKSKIDQQQLDKKHALAIKLKELEMKKLASKKLDAKQKVALLRQKKIELEKLRKTAELERLRLERQREKDEIAKKRALLQEQKLKQEAEKEKARLRMQHKLEKEKLKHKRMLEKQKLQQQRLAKIEKLRSQKLLEQQRKKEEHKILKAERKKLRKRRMQNLMHSLGLRKTEEEKRQAELEKRRRTLLDIKKLEAKRNEWLARQKEAELKKLEKEEELELLRLDRQDKEERLIEKKQELREQRKFEQIVEKPPRLQRKELFTLQPQKVEIPQIPKRQDTLSLDLINTLLENANRDLDNDQLNSSYKSYVEISNIYKKLPPELKKQVVDKCIELHEKLMERFSA